MAQASTTGAEGAAIRSELLRAAETMDRPSRWCGLGDSRRPLCVDSTQRETQWTVSIVTLLVVAVLHVHRLLVSAADLHGNRIPTEQFVRELAIVAIVTLGMTLMWRDLHQCMVYEGLLKLVACVGAANLLVPCIWVIPPLDSFHGDVPAVEEEKEGEDRPPPAAA